ncbi:PAS domain-containing protein [Pseudooceanicola sp. CBS1P-1]|uniref:Histidine kinase n=1 Tax=Pseudooceanicola albus TaxID=2692189 RepID=A0A6L7G5A9_9RHOB|nr:PAS domain-containing protein [Pseudooceanicola endophyticus]MXN19201.1 histidine kinase [Pseudooceanicola albus]
METPDASSEMNLVAIGASAGGLEPLEHFFEAAPEHAGWCFVVIQHLSPDYRSMMDELLGRKSRLKIRHIQDGLALEADTIFLNRPNTMVELEGNRFRTRPYQDGDSLPRLSIDTFLTSLAARAPAHTAAVILSGSGNDGTRGAHMMRDKGSAVIVQSPTEAAFSSMPLAAISSGAVDRVLSAAEIPSALQEIFTGNRRQALSRQATETFDSGIFRLLEDRYRVDFSSYKPTNVMRRIERRQHLRGIGSQKEYIEILANDPGALDELYQDLLIGVTEFYRDPDGIATLRRKVLDLLAQDGEDDKPLRIWVPACASGEEAYTIAIELSEALIAAGSQRRFRVIATDVHRGSLERASTGVYPESALTKIPEELRLRYFEKRRNGYAIAQTLRQKIIFSVHDVLSDPPFMNLDLVSCRNLFIYLNDEPQSRVISMFLFGLRKEGYLFLGPSESLGKYASEFKVLDSRWRLFQKQSQKRTLDRTMLSSRFRAGAAVPPEHPGVEPRPVRRDLSIANDIAELRNRDLLMRAYDAMLKRYAPSSILITGDGIVLAWFGAASIFVDTMNNLADWTVEDIVHPDLHFALNVAMERLRQGQLDSYERQVHVDLGRGYSQSCVVHVEALDQRSRNKLMLVRLVLEDSAPTPDRNVIPLRNFDEGADQQEDMTLVTRRIQELERDLRLTEETLQHVTERLEASGEELQASNEELQASNEELQASNEELQSSNEELHAVNEELVSVSSEHERKIELLSELNANTELVLQILQVGVIFLDAQTRIRRFSQLVAEWFRLESHDVARSLTVVGPRLDFADLAKLAEDVARTGRTITASGTYEGRPLTVEVHPITAIPEEGVGAGVVVILGARPGLLTT